MSSSALEIKYNLTLASDSYYLISSILYNFIWAFLLYKNIHKLDIFNSKISNKEHQLPTLFGYSKEANDE